MPILLAEQTPILSTPSPLNDFSPLKDFSQLKDFLQYGQMGLALATLILGAILFLTALKKPDLSQTTADILKFFAKIMVILFVVSFVGEIATTVMERVMAFYVQMHPVDPHVTVSVEMPPLNSTNYKDYGPIEIRAIEVGKDNIQVHPGYEVQQFLVHNGTQFHIDLQSLTTSLLHMQQQASLVRNESTKGDPTAGAGTAK